MGKSKTIGNIHLLTNEKTTIKKYDREEMMKNIEEVLYPYWKEKSQISILLTDKMRCWTELLKILYHGKMLNISEIQNQIEYVRGKNENLYWNNKTNL